jgi:hypothetical protein
MSNLNDRTQYDRLAQDWRQIHTVVWGIPNVAVAILTGIVLAAYRPELEGWPHIIVLSAGSVLLFALTIEIVEKRIFMNAISARLYFMEKVSHLDPFNIRKLDVTRELNKYNIEMGRELSRGLDSDIPYNLFRWSHAREGLTYVVFVSAIFLAGLAFWEFVKFLNYTEYSYLYAVIPTIIVCGLFTKFEILKVEGRHKCSNCPHTKEFHFPTDSNQRDYCLMTDCECVKFEKKK